MFGSSPDETANFRLYLNKENTAEALTMIQPQLLAFSFGEGAPLVAPVGLVPIQLPACRLQQGQRQTLSDT